MLNKLLHKLKTQKNHPESVSSKSVSQFSDPKQQAYFNYDQLLEDIRNYDVKKCSIFEKIDSNCDVVTPFPRIRYFVLQKLPAIGPLIRNCKFSKFHDLLHSRRKVKMIKLSTPQTIYKDNQQVYPLPQYLQFLKPLLIKQVPTYNHILINDYPPAIGIMPHTDGPNYFSKVFVLSLESYCIIKFSNKFQEKKQEGEEYSVLLEPNSIHIFQQQAYTQRLHGIDDQPIDIVYMNYDNQLKKVTRSTIKNFELLSCRDRLLEGIIKMQEDAFSIKDQNGTLKILKTHAQIKGQVYNYALKIKRRQRVSVTIRQKYQQENLII